jgi:hypothetical protein
MGVPSSAPYEKGVLVNNTTTSSGTHALYTCTANQIATVIGLDIGLKGGSQNISWSILSSDGNSSWYGIYSKYHNDPAEKNFIGPGRVMFGAGQAFQIHTSSSNQNDQILSLIVRDYGSAVPTSAPFEVAKFIGTNTEATGPTTIFTCPSNSICHITSWYAAKMVTGSAGNNRLSCSINGDYLIWDMYFNDNNTIIDGGRHILGPGATIEVKHDNTNRIDHAISYIERDYA